MAEPEHYPSPDFGCPPPNSFQHQPHRSGGFQPSMWSWGCTPTEPSWDHGGPAGWHARASPGFGSNHRGHGPQRPHGKLRTKEPTSVDISNGVFQFFSLLDYVCVRHFSHWAGCFIFAMHHINFDRLFIAFRPVWTGSGFGYDHHRGGRQNYGKKVMILFFLHNSDVHFFLIIC